MPKPQLLVISLLILLSLIIFDAQAQVSGKTLQLQTDKVSEELRLKDAKALRFKHPNTSLELANEALELAKNNNNDSIIAQSHSLLARLLSKQLNEPTEAKHHFYQAIQIYDELDKKKNQISDSIEYADLFFKEKDFNTGHKIIDEALSVALIHGNNLLIAKTLLRKGQAFYDNQAYLKAEDKFLDSLDYLDAQDVDSKTLKAAVFHQLGQVNKRLQRHENTADFHKLALEIHQSLENNVMIARALKNVASAEFKKQNYLEALDYAMRGINLHKDIDEPSEHAELLTVIGLTYRNLNRYETAIEHLIDAQKIYKKLGKLGKVADNSNQIGFLYTRLEKHQQAYEFYKVSLTLPQDQVPLKTLASSYREIAFIELELKHYDVALNMASKAYKVYKENNNPSKQSITARIIGEVYYQKRNVSKALTFYQEALSLATQTSSQVDHVKALNKLGELYIQTDRLKAKPIFLEALGISEDASLLPEKAAAYRGLIKLEQLAENYKKALDYSKQLTATTEQIYQSREQQRLVVEKAKLDSHIMETELISLREQSSYDKLALEKNNNKIKISQQKNMIAELELSKNRYATLLLAVLLFLCVCAAIYFYRTLGLSRKHNKVLDYQATHDPLTDSLNRRGLFNIIEQDFKTDKNSVILADIDHFKSVNDTFGHDAGDEVLRAFVDIIKSCVRDNDIVARFGGEEFCIVLTDLEQSRVESIAENIRFKTETAEFIKPVNGLPPTITCSFGVALAGDSLVMPSELISKADKALYKAKKDGRNKVVVWSNALV
ncbi:tetratricopeptide repeat-containing diguanylate cyclase [uncultured Paraglaciecola sp.]|uniref:tetratricopeptide repeat-containing diguanylate cyclase n=1 Tax=uncultured Paraglaciecola sp. TaxID=1765024 RepID=UPI002598C2AF|nr:tetratricopeptide repeat-containing diguanylate cyclase [uncultured Paraglaciecola sp.]